MASSRAGRRRALLIATDTYRDPLIDGLRAPSNDVDALSRVLSSPKLGKFDVEVQYNQPERAIKRAIYRLFSEATVDDLSLLYFSCHGVRDVDGSLFFATIDTELDYLRVSGVGSDFIKDEIDHSRSRRTVLLLDCCYAGAFAKGVRARSEGQALALEDRFAGRGTVIISAASAVQQSFEGGELDVDRPSFFTEALVCGIESGESDLNEDGLVDVDEAFTYIERRLRETSPRQQPSKRSWDVQGQIILSTVPTSFRLPARIEQLLQSGAQYEVLSGIRDIQNFLYSDDPSIAQVASDALQPLTASNARVIREAAWYALGRHADSGLSLRKARTEDDLLQLVLYRLDVRVFKDSNRDGFGDYRGLVEQLDYLQQLGVTGVVLHPPVNIAESRRRSDGVTPRIVDVEFRDVGSQDDLSLLVDEAHKRNIALILEYVVDLTDRRDRWFANEAQGGESANSIMYIWDDFHNSSREPISVEGRLVCSAPSTGEWAYEPDRDEFYWHASDPARPALDMARDQVIDGVVKRISTWLQLGLDGVWISTIGDLAGAEAPAARENAQRLLRSIRKEFTHHEHARFLMAATPRSPADAYNYLADEAAGVNCSIYQNLSTELFLALARGDVSRLAEALRTPRLPEGSRWCISLNSGSGLDLKGIAPRDAKDLSEAFGRDPRAVRNNQILQRVADLSGGSQAIESLLYGLLLSFPGVPLIYYGDEIGMGANLGLPDSRGLHTPMQWIGDRGSGFSTANPGSFFVPVSQDSRFGQQVVNVELQESSRTSLLSQLRRLIGIRSRNSALANGLYQELDARNEKVLAFARIDTEQSVIVVANFAETFESVSLDLRQWRGRQVQELTTDSILTPIGNERYSFVQSPHTLTWLELNKSKDPTLPSSA